MTTQSGHRPMNNNFPPNYNPNPNYVDDNLQNLQLNRPSNTVNVANGQRGPPPPFGARPEPLGVGPRGPPQGTLPNRPAGGNVGPRPGPFASSGSPVPPLGGGVMSNGLPRGVLSGGPPPRKTMLSFLGGEIGSENQMRGPSFGGPLRGGMQAPSRSPTFSAPPPLPWSAYLYGYK